MNFLQLGLVYGEIEKVVRHSQSYSNITIRVKQSVRLSFDAKSGEMEAFSKGEIHDHRSKLALTHEQRVDILAETLLHMRMVAELSQQKPNKLVQHCKVELKPGSWFFS